MRGLILASSASPSADFPFRRECDGKKEWRAWGRRCGKPYTCESASKGK